METYTATINYKLEELHIYGSSRLGIHKPDTQYCSFTVDHYFNPYDSTWKPLSYTAQCTTGGSVASYTEHTRIRGKRFYELSNHLGNVLTTITDRKLPIGDTTGGIDTVKYFIADISTVNDYYPFGMLQPERSYSLGEYRFGFQGQEKDDEINGNGNHYTTYFRQYNSRLGKWLSIDPRFKKYPSQSDYCSFNNNPIIFIDVEGDTTAYYDRKGNLLFYSIDDLDNAIVVVNDESLFMFELGVEFAQILGIEHDDNTNATWRKSGVSYMADGILQFYDNYYRKTPSKKQVTDYFGTVISYNKITSGPQKILYSEYKNYMILSDDGREISVAADKYAFTSYLWNRINNSDSKGRPKSGKSDIHIHGNLRGTYIFDNRVSKTLGYGPSSGDEEFPTPKYYKVVVDELNIYLYKNSSEPVITVPKKLF